MVVVPDINRFAGSPSDQHDPHQVGERHGQDEQRFEDGEHLRVSAGVKVGKNRQDGQEITDQVAAGIAQEGIGPGKVVREKTEQRAGDHQRDQGDEVLTRRGSECGETQSGDGSEAGA